MKTLTKDLQIKTVCKLKHDIRVESKVDLAKREIERFVGEEVKNIRSLPTIIKNDPFSKLDDEILHRMMRLLYLGKVQGFLVQISDVQSLKDLVKRTTYLREIYGIVEGPANVVEFLISKLGFNVKANLLEIGKFIDIAPNCQIFNQKLSGTNNYLSTVVLIPEQTLLEYSSETLKLPYVTFTKQFKRLAERLDVMEKGVKRGIDELIEHLNHNFYRMPWLGLFKEHIGDYVDWAFSDFRTWGLHFIHKHEGKADPWLARSALNLLGVKERSKVLDPFCGSGTFIADAPLMNLEAYGIDINPLSTMIARVKCKLHELPLQELKETVVRIERKLSSTTTILIKDELQNLVDKLESGTRNILTDKEKVINSILTIKQLIDNECQSSVVKDFLYTILSRVIVEIAEKRRTNRTDIWNKFVKDFIRFYLNAYASQEILRRLGIKINGCCTIITGDAHNVQNLLNGKKMDGIVCSPPYFDALDYVSFSSLPILILNLDNEIGKLKMNTIGAKTRKANLDVDYINKLPESAKLLLTELLRYGRREKARVVLQYLIDMKNCLAEFYKVVNEGARVIFVVGRYHHWKFGGRTMRVDGAQILIDLGEQAGFVLEEELSHNISKIEAGKRIKTESIIIWKKDNIESKKDTLRSRNVIQIIEEKPKIKQLSNWIR